MKRDPRPANAAVLDAVAKPRSHIGDAVAGRVAKGDQEAAARWWRVAIVSPAPRIDVDDPVRRDGHVACMPDAVGKDGGAKAGGKGDAAIVGRARG
jgi:hypothetical protein